MKIAFSGSSGLVGSALTPRLEASGHELLRLVRREPKAGEIRWYPQKDLLQGNFLGEIDAFVHLGGENIAEGRWNPAKKRRIRDSRVDSTTLIAKTLAGLETKPRVLVCASAIGYYGDRGDERLTEASAPGDGFLAEVCRQWEAATQPAKDAGIRVVNMRIGVVLSRRGAALAKMLLPFKLGVGGVIGSGRQYWSCVSRPELVEMLAYAIENDTLEGPVNAVSTAVTNREFTKTLGKILGRPTIFPMPAILAKLVFGEMGDALMLSSTRVVSSKLQSAGYPFMDSDIQNALRTALADA